jgi:hypothetical protein
MFLFAEKEVHLIHAINGTILWDFGPACMRECRIKVYYVNNLVADAAGRYSTGPSNDERCA